MNEALNVKEDIDTLFYNRLAAIDRDCNKKLEPIKRRLEEVARDLVNIEEKVRCRVFIKPRKKPLALLIITLVIRIVQPSLCVSQFMVD